jgi:D-arabinose 1-dehydrogenase-like Zn-dependent alcohol dehydrogenase
MLSYDVVEHGQPLQRALRATPKPTGTEVLMRITRSGVCHSDLHIRDGYFDLGGGKRFTMKDRGLLPPITMGHEPFGIVEAIGPRAIGLKGTSVRVGARRLVYPWIGCGKCASCKAEQDNYCLQPRYAGLQRPGAYSTHMIVAHPKYLIDIGDLDESFAATLACSGLTTYSAINKLPDLGPRDWVTVLGCGGLGLIAISILRAQGIRNIIACDIDETKLVAARTLGAKLTLDTRAPDAAERLKALSQGNLLGALDFVGMPATANLGIAALRRGGRYVICGLFGGEITMSLPPIAQRALGVIGSYVGNLAELKAVVALAKKGKLKPSPVQTRPAAEVNRTLDEMRAGTLLGRVVLDFSKIDANAAS